MNEFRRDNVLGEGREVPVDPAPRAIAPASRVCPVIVKGLQCRMPPLHDAEKCFVHDDRPATVARRQAARRAAGIAATKAKSRFDLTTLEGQKQTLSRVVRNMEAGLISQRKGEAMVRALRTVIRLQRQLDAKRPPVKYIWEVRNFSQPGKAEQPVQQSPTTHRGEFESGGTSPPGEIRR